MIKMKVSYVFYVSDRDGIEDIKKGVLNVSKFDVKECIEEYYKDDKWFDYCKDDFDMYMNESKDVMIVSDSCECYDNFVFVKE